MAFIVRRPASAGIAGTSGVWTNVTPAGIDLTVGHSQVVDPTFTNDNFGVQDVIADPLTAGRLLAFTCYNGLWVSTDYGATWSKLSSGSSPLDSGKWWGSAVSADGSRWYACVGNNQGTFNAAQIDQQIFYSTDRGVTWSSNGTALGDSAYSVDVDPNDALHALATMHGTNHVWETTNGGTSWTDLGAVNVAADLSGYPHFLNSSSIALYVSQAGASGHIYRGVKAGTWTWTQVADLNGYEHEHGYHQIARNGTTFYFPGGANPSNGILRSTNAGVNWTLVEGPNSPRGICFILDDTVYGCRSFPDSTGANMKLTSALLATDTVWATEWAANLFGMTNGPKAVAPVTDGTRFAAVAGCWDGGIWRFIK